MSLINGTVQLTQGSIDALDKLLYSLVNVSSNETQGFFDFLFKHDIVNIGIGLILASQIGAIVRIISEEIISPIINKISINQTKKLQDYKLTVLGIEFKLGTIINTIINFMLMLLIVYYIYKLIIVSKEDFLGRAIKLISKGNYYNRTQRGLWS
jgi:large-conductance mechanosensitive channel